MTIRDKKAKHREGFALFEWLIVILAIAALVVVIVPRIGQTATNAKIRTCQANVDLINSQIELYRIDTGNWPAALKDVTESSDYFRDGLPECPFGTPYVMDPNLYRVAEHSH